MEEIKNELFKVCLENNTLGVTKGYSFVGRDGKQRYNYNDAYYTDGERVCRRVKNEHGEFYYNVELIPVVVETFIMKDGNPGTKTYPLSETPYLCADIENPDLDVLMNFLKFKVHR